MAPPAVLQSYLNAMTKDGAKWRTTDKAWDKLLTCKDRTLARDVERMPRRTVLDPKLLERIQIIIQEKSGPNRGNRDLATPKRPSGARGKGKGTGKGNGSGGGKGRGKGSNPHMAELRIAEDHFLSSGDEPLEFFQYSELNEDARGYFCAPNAQAAADVLEFRMRSTPLRQPCVMVVKEASMQNCNSVNILKLNEHFNPLRLTPLWIDDHGITHNIEVLIFQLGTGIINVDFFENEVQDVQTAAKDDTNIFVQYPNLEEKADFEAKARGEFVKLVTKAVGRLNVYKDSTPTVKRLRTADYKKSTVDILEGTLKIQTDKKKTVMRRSGADGILLNPTIRDEDMTILMPPPEANTMDKAFQVSLSMGKLAYGLTLTKSGLRIRVLKKEYATAKQAMDPQLANAIGSDLYDCRRADGFILHACGVPYEMTDKDLVEVLTIPARDGVDEKAWTCQPIALKTRAVWGVKTIVVKALTIPRKLTFRVRCSSDNKVYPVRLVEQKKQLDVMEKAAEKLEDDEKRSICAVVRPTPKKASRTTPVKPTSWAQVAKSSWNELSEEDPDDMDEDDPPHPDAATDDEASVDGDLISDTEYDKPPKAPPTFLHKAEGSKNRFNLPRPTVKKQADGLVSPRNNAASPAATDGEKADDKAAAAAAAEAVANAPQLTAFQQQLADLERQRVEMATANETFRAQAEERATTQATEMQSLMTSLGSLQNLVANNQRDANERMATADATFTKFQQDMTKAAAQAASDRIADQQLAAAAAAASKSQFDLLLAAITELKTQKATNNDDNDDDDLIDKNAAGSTRKLQRATSEGSKNDRSRSAQRSSP
jgi:phage host-nuclease inhibitor protein Gam